MPSNPFVFYLIRFGAAFAVCYFGTLAVIGLSSPDHFYSPFIAHYLNFIDPLRISLLWGAQRLLSAVGFPSFLRDRYTLAFESGESVRMVYSCIGYGVMSFWAAFVFANRSSWRKKGVWIAGGLVALWLLNVTRIALLLLALHKNWSVPLGWDHHTWFNIAAYGVIFLMIYLYDRSARPVSDKPFRTKLNTNAPVLP